MLSLRWTANGEKHFLRQTVKFWHFWHKKAEVWYWSVFWHPLRKNYLFCIFISLKCVSTCYSSDNCQQLPCIALCAWMQIPSSHRLDQKQYLKKICHVNQKIWWEIWCTSLFDWSLSKKNQKHKKRTKVLRKQSVNSQVFPLSHLFKHLEKGASRD